MTLTEEIKDWNYALKTASLTHERNANKSMQENTLDPDITKHLETL